MRSRIRLSNLSWKTEQSYIRTVSWFWDDAEKMPMDWSREKKVEEWLSSMVKERDISASTQNVRFNALLYFFKNVVEQLTRNIGILKLKPVNSKLSVLHRSLPCAQHPSFVGSSIAWGLGFISGHNLYTRGKFCAISGCLVVLKSHTTCTTYLKVLDVCFSNTSNWTSVLNSNSKHLLRFVSFL